MDLAYLQTRISGVYFGVLNFENLYFLGYWSQLLYFLGLLNKRCILKCFICSTAFFWFQFYSPCASVIMGLHYYHIMLDFCEVNSVLRVFFRILLSESIFLREFSVSGKAFFGVVQKCPTPLIPVCRFVKSTSLGDPRSIKYRQPLILRCALRIKMSVIWGLYSGNILLITLKLDLSREFILMQNSPPFDN